MPMQLPERAKQHISESASFNILTSNLPQEWVIREMNERDYGIDLYVEIVGKSRKLTGDLVAIQVKSKKEITFSRSGRSVFKGIKRSTVNYWLQFPVPVFLVAVCLKRKKAYWVSVQEMNRTGRFKRNPRVCSLLINQEMDFAKVGLTAFMISYLREKRWAAVENAIEKSLMLFASLGLLLLICKRKNDNQPSSTPIHFLVLQFYE